MPKKKDLNQEELLELVTSIKRFSPNFFGQLARLLSMPYPTARHEKVKMLKMVVEKCRMNEEKK